MVLGAISDVRWVCSFRTSHQSASAISICEMFRPASNNDPVAIGRVRVRPITKVFVILGPGRLCGKLLDFEGFVGQNMCTELATLLSSIMMLSSRHWFPNKKRNTLSIYVGGKILTL
ncbi:hypothetical protein C0J52_00743 [Blattella germanica]|nr:hypothetical protein C0J52_00743 [Blattella germanica]